MRDDKKTPPGAAGFKAPVDSKLSGTLIEKGKLSGTLLDKQRQSEKETKPKEIPKTPEDCIGMSFYLSNEKSGEKASKEAFFCEGTTPRKSDTMLNLKSKVDGHKFTIGFNSLVEKLSSERKLWTLE